MATPIALSPAYVSALFDAIPADVPTPLSDRYFPLLPSKYPGADIVYDVLADSRIRPLVNTRSGPADYVGGESFTTVKMPGQTWRDGRRIPASVMADLRRPGTPEDVRGQWQIARDTQLLHRRWRRFIEWLSASGLRGLKVFYPPGMSQTITEILLTDTSFQSATVTADWSAVPASEAAARTALAAVRTDFEAADASIEGEGGSCDEVVMSYTTRGYLDQMALIAGYNAVTDIVVLDGHLEKLFGKTLVVNRREYIHPITGVATQYIPDDFCAFVDSDNTRSGRRINECSPLHVNAPETPGVYISTLIDEEPPGEVRIVGTWTGGPVIAWPGRMYLYTDVTAAA